MKDTAQTRVSPWSTGPGEILKHGLSLLKKDSDTNRRLAMINIDNAVELMIKTYLGLPKRVTRFSLPRKEYQEIAERFPALLDALEKYAADKLDGVNLGDLEWYHRLRNELYHQGNGLTVERQKVEVYSELAKILFSNLFGYQVLEQPSSKSELLGEFMEAWLRIENGLRENADRNSMTGFHPPEINKVLKFARGAGLIPPVEYKEIMELRKIRNQVIHGPFDYREILTPEIMSRTLALAAKYID